MNLRSVALLALVALGCACTPSTEPTDRLTLYCAAGLRAPVESIVKDYRERFGVAVEIQYGGSGTLLSGLKINPRGDLYLAADVSYVDKARELGLVAEMIPVARLAPVLVVREGNPTGVRSLDDLTRADVRVVLANPEAAAIGKMSRRLLEAHGSWAELEPLVRVFKPTVHEVANDVRLGNVDVGIVWDAIVPQHDGLEAVPIAGAADMSITVGVLTKTQNSPAALRFARYLSGEGAGLSVFEREGYRVESGDPFEPSPEITLFCGAMLSPGLVPAIERFRKREGVEVRTSFQGCGLLVAQMKQGVMPGAYVSCDESFMQMVADRFEAPTLLTRNAMVILVRKGNPKNIHGVDDLARPDVRVGLAHETHSALGHLTYVWLDDMKQRDAVVANRAVESATGDFLVNQLRAGSLDAVVVYRSNALAHQANVEEHFSVVDIDHAGARAAQPYAIAKGARHHRLLERFFDTVRTAESRRVFESVGFEWGAP